MGEKSGLRAGQVIDDIDLLGYVGPGVVLLEVEGAPSSPLSLAPNWGSTTSLSSLMYICHTQGPSGCRR